MPVREPALKRFGYYFRAEREGRSLLQGPRADFLQ